MFANILILAILGFVAVLGNAMPTSTTSAANPVDTQVRIHTFKEDDCGGAYKFLWVDPDICIDFDADMKSLRVVGHDGDIWYHARKSALSQVIPVKLTNKQVNTYEGHGCHSWPRLQPIYGYDINCFNIVDADNRSIRLSIGLDIND